MALIPRDYQNGAVDSLFHFFKTHPDPIDNPVVALPTGTGKALVIAEFLRRAFAMYSKQKVLVATHVKELIDQNYEEFLEQWPQAPAGVYSAGLNRKDTLNRIIFCGIASIVKNLQEFGKVDILMIDECHLLSQDDESMYLRVIALLKAINPRLRVVGLTATPWRAGQGKITDDGIFTHICYDGTGMKAFNWFIKQGYLVPVVPKRTETFLDVSGVHLRGGEFVEKELQLAVNKDEITYAALKETLGQAHDRKHWLIFGAGVAHVVRITEMLNAMGVSARCVHSNTKDYKMTAKQRDENIADWKAGKFVAMVNNGILTTGVNFKAIDLIVMLRPTHSTVLWIQMLGRGTRPLYAPGYDITTLKGRLDAIFNSAKQNCLVLDFAGNSKRLGPINDPVIPRKKGEKTGEVPIKICEGCGTYNHISARHCGGEPFRTNEGCGMEFQFKVLLKQFAATDELIKTDEPIIETFTVKQITFQQHQKVGKPPSVLVTYWCGLHRYREFICFEHGGQPERKARSWWKDRTDLPFPPSTAVALELADKLRVPNTIRVWLNKPYPEVLLHDFSEPSTATVNVKKPEMLSMDSDIPF
jgi:DNA repair protein RadD